MRPGSRTRPLLDFSIPRAGRVSCEGPRLLFLDARHVICILADTPGLELAKCPLAPGSPAMKTVVTVQRAGSGLDISPDCQHLLVGPETRLCSLNGDPAVRDYRVCCEHGVYFGSSPSEALVVSNESVSFLSLASGRSVVKWRHHEPVSATRMSPNRQLLLVEGKNRYELRDIATNRILGVLDIASPRAGHHSVTALTNQGFLAVGEGDRVAIFDLPGQREVRSIRCDGPNGPQLEGRIVSLSFSPDGSYLAIGWRGSSSALVGFYPTIDDNQYGDWISLKFPTLNSLAISPSGDRLVCCHDDECCRIEILELVGEHRPETTILRDSDDQQESLEARSANDEWLGSIRHARVRKALLFLDAHDSITVADLEQLVGGPRKFRAFLRELDEIRSIVPFHVMVETDSGTSVYRKVRRPS